MCAILLCAGPRILFLPLGIFMWEIRCLRTNEEKGEGEETTFRDTYSTYRIRTVLHTLRQQCSKLFFPLPLRSLSQTPNRNFSFLYCKEKVFVTSPSRKVCVPLPLPHHLPHTEIWKSKLLLLSQKQNSRRADFAVTTFRIWVTWKTGELGWRHTHKRGGGKGNKGIRERRCCVYYTIPFFSRW